MLNFTLANHEKDYTLTRREMAQFICNAAPYAERHKELGHHKIAFLYRIPLIGQLGALIERLIVWASKFFSANPYPVYKRYENEAANPELNFSERIAALDLPADHRLKLAQISAVARGSNPNFCTVELPKFNLPADLFSTLTIKCEKENLERYKKEASDPQVDFSKKVATLNLSAAHRYELAQISATARGTNASIFIFNPHFYTTELSLFNLSCDEHLSILIEKLHFDWKTFGRLNSTVSERYYTTTTTQAVINYMQKNLNPATYINGLNCYRRLNINHPELYLQLRFPEEFKGFGKTSSTSPSKNEIKDIFLRNLSNLENFEIWHLFFALKPCPVFAIQFSKDEMDEIMQKLTLGYNNDLSGLNRDGSCQFVSMGPGKPEVDLEAAKLYQCFFEHYSSLGLDQIIEVEEFLARTINDSTSEVSSQAVMEKFYRLFGEKLNGKPLSNPVIRHRTALDMFFEEKERPHLQPVLEEDDSVYPTSSTARAVIAYEG